MDENPVVKIKINEIEQRVLDVSKADTQIDRLLSRSKQPYEPIHAPYWYKSNTAKYLKKLEPKPRIKIKAL